MVGLIFILHDSLGNFIARYDHPINDDIIGVSALRGLGIMSTIIIFSWISEEPHRAPKL